MVARPSVAPPWPESFEEKTDEGDDEEPEEIVTGVPQYMQHRRNRSEYELVEGRLRVHGKCGFLGFAPPVSSRA